MARAIQSLIPILATLHMIAAGAIRGQDNSNKQSNIQSEPKTINLLARASQKERDYGQSAFSFRYGVRSDDDGWRRITGNRFDLLYGSITINHDSDWFEVSAGDPSRIKDLGPLEWADAQETPILEVFPRASSAVRMPGHGESFEESSEGRVTKAVEGHMYVVHIKNDKTDHYAMFRVEAIEPSKSCTISWKLVPSPEK